MRTMTATLTAALLATASLATTPHDAGAQEKGGTAQGPAPVVQVQNDKNVPVTVFIDRGPFDLRLGVVGAMQTATLKLPGWVVNAGEDVQVFVHPEGGSDLASQKFSLRRGATLAVLVPANEREVAAEPAPATMSAVIPPSELGATTLTVENQRPVSVVMYVEQGDFDVRLGSVPANSTTTLTLPPSIVARNESVEIFAHPERGQDLSSTRLALYKGEHLGLRLTVR